MTTEDQWGRPLDCRWCPHVATTWEDLQFHINGRHPTAGRDEVKAEIEAIAREQRGKAIEPSTMLPQFNTEDTGAL